MKIFRKFYFWLPMIFFAISLIGFLLYNNSNNVGNNFLILIIIGFINPFNWIPIDLYNFEQYDFSFKFIIGLLVGILMWFLIGLLIDKIINRFKKQ